jgi:hypothetical protein
MNAPLRKKPAPAQSPLRALTFFQTLPPGHKTFLVDDGSSAPHLKPGEFAVIDTADTELQKGEVYLIQYESGRRSRRLVQIGIGTIGTNSGRSQTVWWASDLAGFRQVDTMVDSMLGSIPVFSGLSDGPYRAQALRRKLLGRVVGYSETGALGDHLQACGEPVD